ncbi:MAG: PTS transporter subunit EIIC [Coriobacteriia bacterium]|nr:PTS transporter subunit EIIC [Coriobacteriia bacterium]
MAANEAGALTTFMEEKFVPIAAKIGGQRHLLALRDGIIMIMPLLILGSFAMVIIDFPIPAWAEWMETHGWYWDGGHLDVIMDATFGIMAIIAAFGVASALASSYRKANGDAVDGIPAGILAIAAFFILTQGEGMDSEYLFVALMVGLFVGEIYRLFIQKDWVIKLPETVPLAIARQFTALLPGAAILAFLWLFIAVPMRSTEAHTISNWLNTYLFSWLANVGLSYPATMLGSFLEHLLWCFGIHGAAVVIFPFYEPLWLSAIGTDSIITWPFYENGVWIGGSGATLPVVIYMLLFAKSRLLKDIGRISIVPGLFNINETVTFGLPVVLNPMLMIPYVVTPLVIVTIMYFGTSMGIFPVLDKLIPWTTPVFISGFLAASGGLGDRIMAVVGQIICFAVAFLIWLPFIRAWDKVNVLQEEGIELVE